MFSLEIADTAGVAWAQAQVETHHYLHKRVDPRSRPLVYLVRHPASGAPLGTLIVGRPEASCCYVGRLTYGGPDARAAGRAAFDRWEVLNLARVWLAPRVQAGGDLFVAGAVPCFVDRRGVPRSTLASALITQLQQRVGTDYLAAHPPVDCLFPYAIRALLSYCDTRVHRGTIYRASGFQCARTNPRGIETWWTPDVAPLTAGADARIRALAASSARSQRIRATRIAA